MAVASEPQKQVKAEENSECVLRSSWETRKGREENEKVRGEGSPRSHSCAERGSCTGKTEHVVAYPPIGGHLLYTYHVIP